MNSQIYTHTDVFPYAAKFGYDDFVALQRHKLSTHGPVVQYANAYNFSALSVLPVKNFKNTATQTAIYEEKLLGEGFDTNTFKQDILSYRPTFEVPILCQNDNLLANYVYDIFDLLRKAPYGDAVEHVGRVSSVNGTSLVLNSREKYLCQLLKNNFLNVGNYWYLRIVDGKTLKSLTGLTKVSNISVNNCTITLENSISASGDFLLAVFVFCHIHGASAPIDTPPSKSGYEYSNEFYLASSRDGMYYPCLIDSVDFNINAELPSLSVNCFSKRLDKLSRLYLNNESELPTEYPVYSIPKNEQARIKITPAGGKTVFYGIMPVIQTGTIETPNPLFDYKTGVHFGNDGNNLASPEPLLIKNANLNISNNLNAIYSLHSPRFTLDASENYINDLSRHDNACAYAFYSTQRKIAGSISITVPEGEWFKKEFLPAVNSNTEGSIEIDTGYLNIRMDNLVFNLSADDTAISSEYEKQANFSFASNKYDAMFEIGISKTGGRL
jgi:hypothetical protein